MPQINIHDLTFAYPGSADNVFENLNLNLDTDWRLGLIGRNGRGKTTLLRLLSGELTGSGHITVPEPAQYFPPPDPGESETVFSAMETLAPGLQFWEAERELSRIGSHIASAELPFAALSPGERTQALLAALFLGRNGYLLIDEPTNHLDADSRRSLAAYLAAQRGFLLVSHDRAFLDACTDHTVAINRSSIDVQQGNFSAWKAEFDARQTAEAQRSEQLRKEIQRLGRAADRSEQWSRRRERSKNESFDSGFEGHRAAKVMKRAKAAARRRSEAAEEKKTLLTNTETAESLKMFPVPAPKELLASFSGVMIDYPGGPFPTVSFDIRRGDRIVLRGGNGTGKTSLLRLLAGDDVPHTGELSSAGGLRISWLPQDTSGCCGSLRNLADSRGLDWTQFLTMLRQLDLPRSLFERPLETFSEGQRKKTLLAASLCERAHLYVWDEPLNYVDLYTRMQLEELILRVRPTLLMVEHDAAFTDAVAAKYVALERAGGFAAVAEVPVL